MTDDLDPTDLGRDVTYAPRGPRIATGPRHWAIVELDGHGPTVGVARGQECRSCREVASVLHADPESTAPHRVICSRCTGDSMRKIVGWATAKEPTEKRGRS